MRLCEFYFKNQTSLNVHHDRVVLHGEILARRMLPLFVWKLLTQSHKEDSYLRFVNMHFQIETVLIGHFHINLADKTLGPKPPKYSTAYGSLLLSC